jgi:hypothetical protein
MKKLLILLLMLILLSGCNLFNEAKNTVTYINEATDFLATATDFANEAPLLVQKAVNDTQAAQELETLLLEMKQEIEAFNTLEAPELASDLHQQLVDQNNLVVRGIDTYLGNIKDGKLDPSVIENTEVFTTIQDLTAIIDQIKQLGQ